MKTPDAFKKIVDIENSVNIKVFIWKSFNTWPLLRKILWFELIAISSNNKVSKKKIKVAPFIYIRSIISSIYRVFKNINVREDAVKIFFSRPEYLQELNSKKFIDRIVDPIIESLREDEKITKYYLSRVSKEKNLLHDALYLHQNAIFTTLQISVEQKETIHEIAKLLDINGSDLERDYKNQLRLFIEWYISAKKLLSKHKKLKEIYLTCWYLPDLMGICAAASELKITTIDIQHGKQGKFQAMYSGWTNIPRNGYDLMPEKFWCWGTPSCNHILEASPNRTKHIPFVGGYPWVTYYQKNIGCAGKTFLDKKIRVLLTMQPPQGDNCERIPNFIINFLASEHSESIHFIFRLHPNDIEGNCYCRNRLKLINPDSYTIDDGKKNLYDLFAEVTHHITAFSSCCYEARLFNISTLLYGHDSKEIYEDEIKNKVFSWTDSNTDELISWLQADNDSDLKIANQYIDNSLYEYNP